MFAKFCLREESGSGVGIIVYLLIENEATNAPAWNDDNTVRLREHSSVCVTCGNTRSTANFVCYAVECRSIDLR